ncbi:hypothetical protein LPYR103PRE_23060 [Segatella asaccharophila]|jgi:hypothetical protein
MKSTFVKSSEVVSHKIRFDSKHYLTDDAYLSMIIERHSNQCAVLSELAEVFNPPVFKRQFCKKTNRSVEYFQSSDVPMSTESSPVNIYKGQAENLNLLVAKGDILITGFGTIGYTRLVSKWQDGVCYANNVCRVKTYDNVHSGYVYAFLSSKFGWAQLNKNASGSVVRYIEAPGIRKTLIPKFPDSFQAEVDNLIQESSRLREEANDKLKEAKSRLIDFCNQPFSKSNGIKCNSIKISNIRKSLNTRFDPPIYINDGVDWMAHIKKETVLLGDIDVKTWYPGIFKRIYVKKGLPYIKGSSVFNINPFRSCDHLSSARTPMLDELWLTDGLLLITCAGAVGLVKMITKEYEDKGAIGSPDIIRLSSKDALFTTEYLFTYLQLPAVYDYMQSLKYGSVIERFDIANVETIPVVKPTIELSGEITELIKDYKQCMYHAFNAEEKATKMVENEIEKWNKTN